jgi:PAS domain S-box-containing protein
MWEKVNSVGSWEGDVWDRRKNGEIYPAHLIITAIKDKDGALANYVATYSDITERKQVEDKLRKSEEILRESQDIAGLGSYELDIPTGYWESSEILDHVFGIDDAYERSVGGWEALIHPQDRAMMVDYFWNEVLGKGGTFDKEYRIIRPSDQAERWVHGVGRLELDAKGQLLKMRGTIQDITERKRIELALQDSEARYRSFAEELPLGIIITQDGHVKYVNRAAVGMFGYPEEEIVEKPFLPFVDEPDRAWLIDLHQRRMRGEKVESPYVIGVLRGDGTVHQWQLHSSTIEWEGKLAALASIDDITERRQYEQDLRIAATTFESQEGVVITDADNVILRVNRSFINITGYSAEEVIGRKTTMFNSGRHDPDFYAAMWERINSNGSWEGDVWNQRKNGENYPAHLTISAVKGKDDILTNYVATYSDITARVTAEEKLLDSLRKLEEKEQAKTRFLAAAGHDLRQPIAAATLFLEALKFTSQTLQQSELTERIDHSMRIFSSLLDRLLDISKFDAGLVKPQISTFHLADLFSWLERNFDQTALSRELRLRLFFPSNRPLVVSTDIALVHSVLMNLVSNALKFTRRGSILVSARLRGDTVLMQVWDTGIGIAKADLPHIFDEFYQVANPQRNREAGLGLGLSICQRAMSLLGSEITCRSRLGHGSIFEFSLPLSDKPQEAMPLAANNAPDKAADKMQVRGKRVVVVEDDALVAAGLVRLLYGLGAEVWHFHNAEEALQQTDIANTDFFLVDYALGSGLNGIQFLETAQRKHPTPIRAVIITGETSSQFISSVSNCPWPVLHKPVSYAKLASCLNQ